MGEAKHGPILLFTQGHAGDRLGARLAPALRERFPDRELVGTGGEVMQAAGVRLLARTDGISAIGWTGLLPHIPAINGILNRVSRATRETLPSCMVCVDVWQPLGFLHRRAPWLLPIPHICYLPPGPNFVGTSRVHGAAAQTFKSIITPFAHQARLFEEAGARVRMAGHAGIQRMREQVSALPWNRREPVLALLPGSRGLEVRCGLPVQMAAADKIVRRQEALTPEVCCASEEIERYVNRRYPAAKTSRNAWDLLARARFGLICSGTATLEAAVLGCPGVVTYNASPLQLWEWRTFHVPKLAKMRAAGIASPYVALPNIISGKELYPELLNSTGAQVAEAALRLLSGDPAAQSEALTGVPDKLNWEDAGFVVAEETFRAIEENEERRSGNERKRE
jgi:lipid-A-disaccharide synthase